MMPRRRNSSNSEKTWLRFRQTDGNRNAAPCCRPRTCHSPRKDEVGETPAGHRAIVRFGQLVPLHQLATASLCPPSCSPTASAAAARIPARSKRRFLATSRPPKQIAIVDIKRLIGRRRFGRRPERGTRQQPALGHFQQAVVSARFAGKRNGSPSALLIDA